MLYAMKYTAQSGGNELRVVANDDGTVWLTITQTEGSGYYRSVSIAITQEDITDLAVRVLNLEET